MFGQFEQTKFFEDEAASNKDAWGDGKGQANVELLEIFLISWHGNSAYCCGCCSCIGGYIGRTGYSGAIVRGVARWRAKHRLCWYLKETQLSYLLREFHKPEANHPHYICTSISLMRKKNIYFTKQIFIFSIMSFIDNTFNSVAHIDQNIIQWKFQIKVQLITDK